MGMGTTVIPRYYRDYGVKFYDRHRSNCGDGDNIYGSSTAYVTFRYVCCGTVMVKTATPKRRQTHRPCGSTAGAVITLITVKPQ